MRSTDELASLALGEEVDADIAGHVERCESCQHELHSLRATVQAGRAVAQPADAPPPPAVWERITRELEPPRPRRTLTWLAAAAAVVIVAAGVGGWAIGRRDGSAPASTAHAALASQAGTVGATGTAIMRKAGSGFELELTTRGLPDPSGFYEVWLYDPASQRMVAVGTLGPDATGTFTMPAGLDTSAFHVVDVSIQRYDGNPTHQRSVLRGPLVPS